MALFFRFFSSSQVLSSFLYIVLTPPLGSGSSKVGVWSMANEKARVVDPGYFMMLDGLGLIVLRRFTLRSR